MHVLGYEDPARPGCYLGTLQAVAEQGLAEAELRHSEQRRRTILEAAPIDVALADAEASPARLYANSALAQMLGVETAPERPNRLHRRAFGGGSDLRRQGSNSSTSWGYSGLPCRCRPVILAIGHRMKQLIPRLRGSSLDQLIARAAGRLLRGVDEFGERRLQQDCGGGARRTTAWGSRRPSARPSGAAPRVNTIRPARSR